MVSPLRQRPPLWPLLITLLVVLLDQVSKYLVVRYLAPENGGQSISILGSWVRLTYLENSGISFGQLQDMALPITVLTMILTIGLFAGYRYLVGPLPWANGAVGLILGGALGNLIDRVLTGLRFGLAHAYVVDFVDVRYFAVFNIADSAITIGGILYGVYLVFFYQGGPMKQDVTEKELCAPPPEPPSAA